MMLDRAKGRIDQHLSMVLLRPSKKRSLPPGYPSAMASATTAPTAWVQADHSARGMHVAQ
jgi:hypothetical protein